MTTDYNPTEAQRLIAEAREDDERMTSGQWRSYSNRVFQSEGGAHFTMFHVESFEDRDANAIAIARTRNNLPAIADQLEAAGMEVERLVKERDRVVAHGHEALAERDSLRAEVNRLTLATLSAPSIHGSTINEVATERDSLRARVEDAYRHIAALQIQVGDVVDEEDVAQVRSFEQALGATETPGALSESDSLRQQLEAAQREIAQLRDGGASLFDRIGANRIADEVAVLVDRKVIDSRSPAADALLDYREPPRSVRSDRLVDLERDLAAAQQQLEAWKEKYRVDTNTYEETIADLQRPLTAAQRRAEAGGNADIGNYRAVNDSLRQQLEAAQRTAVALGEHADALAGMAVAHEMDRLRYDIAAGQQRIAELEAALRAIYPVYMAAEEWHGCSVRGLGGHKEHDLDHAVDTARAALTPEIIAALKRAGLE